MSPRSFDEHLLLLTAFGERVAQLPPAAWDRLRSRCGDLDSSAFSSLLRRASLAAKPYELSLPPGAEPRIVLRMLAGASRAFQRSMAFAGQVMAEFDASSVNPPRLPPRRARKTGNPRTDTYGDAHYLIEASLAPFERTNPGLVTAIRAAGQAVLLHDYMSPADFDTLYALVEPEIPYAELSPPSSES